MLGLSQSSAGACGLPEVKGLGKGAWWHAGWVGSGPLRWVLAFCVMAEGQRRRVRKVLRSGQMCGSRSAETHDQTYQCLQTRVGRELVTGAVSLSAGQRLVCSLSWFLFYLVWITHVFHWNFSNDPFLCTVVIFFFPFYPQLFFVRLSDFFFLLASLGIFFFLLCTPPCCLHLFFLYSSSYIFPLLTLILRGTSFTLGDQPFLIDCQLLLLKLICILSSYCARQRTSDFE